MRIFGIVCLLSAACGVQAPDRRSTEEGPQQSGLAPTALKKSAPAVQMTCDASTAKLTLPCEDTGFAPDADAQGFRHWSTDLRAIGRAKHRGVDAISTPGHAQTVEGKFAYGLTDADMEDEVVEVWAQTSCNSWEKLGSTLTDDHGFASFALPSPLPEGDYRVRLLVQGDHSHADLFLRVWPTGTHVVVSDVDGTMTTKENDGVWAWFDAAAADAQPLAADLMQAYYAKGYRLLFLTARAEILTNGTKRWFADNGFPPATFHLSRSDFGELGQAAEDYKQQYLSTLSALSIDWAYGNKVTDLDAYLATHVGSVILHSGQYDGDLKGATRVDTYDDEYHRVACMPPL